VEGVKKIKVGSVEVGLIGLDMIFEEVRGLEINNSNVLKEELLKRVKSYNCITETRENEFARAIFEAYRSFCKKADSEAKQVE